MCELLVTRGNRFGHTFSLKAYESARLSNYDGAGYALFEAVGDGKWIVKDIRIFPEKWKYNSTYTYNRGDNFSETSGHFWQKRKGRKGHNGVDHKQTAALLNAGNEYGGSGFTDAEIQQMQDEWETEEALSAAGYTKDEIDEVIRNMRTGGYKEEEEEEKGEQIAIIIPENKAPLVTDIKALPTYPSRFQVRGFEDRGIYSYRDNAPEEIHKVQEALTPNQLLVSHFRFATSGENVEKNTHPVVEGDYAVIHNGVFGYKEVPAGISDTRLFTETLNRKANRMNIRTPRVEQAVIDKLLEKAGGYYSVFIYSWRTKRLYYYKTDRASFYWDITGLLGATKSARFPVTVSTAKSMIVQ